MGFLSGGKPVVDEPISVDDNNASLTVDVGSSALPSGAATAARQDTGNTSLAAIDSKLGATLTVSVSGSVAVTGTFWQSTQPVSAASLPLPSGAATSSNQSTAITSLADLLVEMRVQNGGMAQQYDYVDATTEYLGWAEPGTATSAASWRVKKITTTGSDIAITWADSNRNFDNAWDNRASLTYG